VQIMPRFNLIEEPWIPVREGGTLREVGIREALRIILSGSTNDSG